ncbi:MAG: hypothetical protein FVQ85_03630 [Planctomycetes bacterium]|nr:hypothetical protein [Planctomycetota bacterium]
MAEEKAKKNNSGSSQRMAKWIRYVAIAILIVAIGCYFLSKTDLLDFETVDEQLAAIEAARAIPDEENAAIIYNQLLENYHESSLVPDFMDELDYVTGLEPWSSKDYPELAEWLDGRQETISTLLLASKKEECRFPIITDVQQMPFRMEQVRAMSRLSTLLSHAANNDIAEDRVDAFIQKYHCLIQMANHLCQQPVTLDFLFGTLVDSSALDGMRSLIVEGNLTQEHLRTIEAALPHTKDNWAEISSRIIEFETLYGRKNQGLFDRLKFAWQGIRLEDTVELIQDRYLRQLADRRSNRIFIALRRYRNTNGRWPQTLDGIKNLVPEQILVDPINGGSFVYKLTEENFTLYSKGKNNIDEAGERSSDSGADDWPIWSRGN